MIQFSSTAARALRTGLEGGAEHLREAGVPAAHRLRVDLGSRGREPRRGDAARGRQPDLKALAGRPEGRAHARRPQQRQPARRCLGGAVEPEQSRCRHRGAEAAAYRRRMPAAVIEGRVRGPRHRAHRLEPGGVGLQRLPHAGVPLGAEDQRRRRRRRAEVCDARQVCVVEVEHVPRRPRGGDPLEQALAGACGGERGRLLGASGRAGEPVEEGDPVSLRRVHRLRRLAPA